MQFTVNAVHFKADSKLIDFVSLKLEKLGQYYEGVIGGEVKLKLDNSVPTENKITEIMLKIKGEELFAKKQSKSFEESTDLAIEALRRQLTKYKGKLSEKNRK
jgi:ribosome hibernation promoting factor